MMYTASEKLAIVRLVEESELSVRRILGEIKVSRSSFYRWYRADEERIYVVRANGAVEPSHSAEWFGDNLEVRPGDTIVVPLDAERMKTLTLWTNISQIIYQIGIAAASWNAVGIF